MLAFIRSLGGSAGALRGGSIIGAGSVGCGNGLVLNDCTEVTLVSFIGFLGLNPNSSSSEAIFARIINGDISEDFNIENQRNFEENGGHFKDLRRNTDEVEQG